MQIAVRITLSSISPEPTYTGGPFVSGVAQLETANPATTDWETGYFVSCGAFGERVDIVTGGNYGQLMDSEMEISNHDKWFAAFSAAGASLVGAVVEIGEATSSIDMDLRWTGTVADSQFQGMNIEMRVENILATRHKTIPARALTAQEFPGLSSDAEGAAVPILYGAPERIEPSSLLGDPVELVAMLVNEGTKIIERTTTYIMEQAIGGPYPVTATALPLVVAFDDGGYSGPFPPWVNSTSTRRYVEIVSGKGVGQRRSVRTSFFPIRFHGAAYISGVLVELASPWDTIPDATSTFRIVEQTTFARLAVGDECVIDEITEKEFGTAIPFEQTEEEDIQIADISAEFMQGDNYSAIEYYKPSEDYGITSLSDGRSASAGNTVRVLGFDSTFSPVRLTEGDLFCRARLDMIDVSDAIIANNSDVYFLFAADYFSIADNAALYVQVKSIRWDGGIEYTSYSVSNAVPASARDINAYSPGIIADGTAGNFGIWAVKIDSFARPLAQYKSILFGLAVERESFTATGIRACTGVEWFEGENYVMWNTATAGALPVAGEFIRPRLLDAISFGELNQWSEYNIERFAKTDASSSMIAGSANDWRKVSAATLVSGTVYQVDFVSATDISPTNHPATVADGVYASTWVATEDNLRTFDEMECGVAFSSGTIEPGAAFLASVSSGRTYGAHWTTLPSGVTSGDPITLARDAVLDMYYRDLALPAAAVDFASFQALPADTITSAMVERIDSAERVASLCQQFNWVIGHDADGRETAFAWLSRVGSTDYDLSIDTGDVVEGTLTGVGMTDILDLVNLPNIKWNWTQADGFRNQSNVSNVAADPLSLNAGNYLQYLTGFGDFSTALDVYNSLHQSYRLNTYQKSAVFEMPDVGIDASGVLWPMSGMSRFDWMASRKPLYSLVVPDTSAAASCIIGQRVRLRHKRYTAGSWVYGTIVEWSLDPMAAECAITVMGDPAVLSESDLLEDVIDPTGTIEIYEDTTDGVSDQLIDTLAGDLP